MERMLHGCKVHYTLSEARDTRVLLLHGWGCSEKLMQPVAKGLEDRAQTLTLDFPGFGASEKPPQPWGVEDYATCVRELLEAERFTPCTVIAHSFGCRVALYLAAEDASLFERMILTGAAGLKKPQTEEGRKRAEQFQRGKKLSQMLKKTHLFGSIPDRMEQALREKYGSRDYNALDEEMRRTFVKVISLDLADRLPRVSCPALLVFGDQDTETPLWMGRKMEKDMPNAGLAIFEGGTHFAYLEQLPRFLAVSRHFLEMNA